MIAPRAVVLVLAALAATVVAAPTENNLEARATCSTPTWGNYTCTTGSCCICDSALNPGCFYSNTCWCIA
ncbi:hypothetical protein BKA62DRAFT_724098 [Auriculariales sp. MPI-PUGE-AT-0066]|nr:hypothetical protein BKA62DRAFT_724098 [Auriculariales sp. MPI-PUGE-AT-0066]